MGIPRNCYRNSQHADELKRYINEIYNSGYRQYIYKSRVV